MNAIRLAFVLIVCLGIRFIVDWQLHQPSDPVSIAPVITSVAQRPQPPLAATKSPLPRTQTTQARTSIQSAIIERLAELRSPNNVRIHGRFIPFRPNGVDPQFAALYDLTPLEAQKVNVAYQMAKQRLDELSNKHAQLSPSSSPEKLVITVLPFPEEGGQIYSNLIANFETLLGPERYAMFNEISEDDLERSLDGCGLGITLYEVTLGEIQNGNQIYEIKKKFDFPPTADFPSGYSNTAHGKLTADWSVEVFPVLRSYTLPSVPSAK